MNEPTNPYGGFMLHHLYITWEAHFQLIQLHITSLQSPPPPIIPADHWPDSSLDRTAPDERPRSDSVPRRLQNSRFNLENPTN